MRCVVDESTGMAVVVYLRNTGHDVLAIAEVMPEAEDVAVLALAVREQRLLVTNDKDFGELVFRSGQAHQGILLLRLQDEAAANKVRVVTAVFEQYADKLVGSFTVATEHNVRVRPIEGREP